MWAKRGQPPLQQEIMQIMITRIQKQKIFERNQPSRVDKIIISCANIHSSYSAQYSSSRHTALNTLIQLNQRGLSGILYHEYTKGAFLKSVCQRT